METDPLILEDMQRLGLDPSQWRYDPKSHRYVQTDEEESPAVPAKKPLLATADWDPQTGAKMPSNVSLARDAIKQTWEDINTPTVEIVRRRTPEDISNPVLRGAVNFGGGVANSLTSPVGLATLPLMSAKVVAAIPRIASTAGVGFAALGAKGGYEAASNIKKQLKSDEPLDAEKLVENAGQLAMAPLMVYGGGKLAEAGYKNIPARATPPTAAATVQNAPPVKRGILNEPLGVSEPQVDGTAPVNPEDIQAVKDAQATAKPVNPNLTEVVVKRSRPVVRAADPFGVEGSQANAQVEPQPLTPEQLALSAKQKLDPATLQPLLSAAPRDMLGVMQDTPANVVDPNFAPLPKAPVRKPVGQVTDPFGMTGKRAPEIPVERLGTPQSGEPVSPTLVEIKPNAKPEATKEVPAVKPAEPVVTPKEVKSPVAEPVKTQTATADDIAAYEKLTDQQHQALRDLHKAARGDEAAGHTSYFTQWAIDAAKALKIPGRFYSEGLYKSARDLSEADLNAKLRKQADYNAELERKGQEKLDSLDPATAEKLRSLYKKYGEARKLQADLRRSPGDYSAGQRAAASRAANKLMRELMDLERSLGIDSYQSAGISRLLDPRIERPSSGLKINTNPNAGQGGFVDLRGALDTLKRVTSGAAEITRHGIEVGKQLIPGIKQLPFHGAAKLGDALDALYTKRRELGRYANQFRAAITDSNMPAAERAQAAAIADKRARNYAASNALDPEAAAILKGWRATLKEMRSEQIASGQPVWDPNTGTIRQAGMDEFYFPEVAARQVISELRRKGSASQYYTDYIDKRIREGMTRETAINELNQYLDGFDIYGNHSGGHTSTFGAVRKVEGKGLPDSWIDPNPDRGLNRYANNFARDRALYDVIEKDHDVMTMLGHTKDFYDNPIKPKMTDLPNLSGEPLIKRTLEEYFGVGSDISNPVIRGLNQDVKSTIIGIPSKITDLAGVARMANFLPEGLKQVPGLMKHLASLDRLRIAGQHAIDQGLARPGLSAKASAYNIIKNITKHHETWGEALTELANIAQRVQGTHQMELFAKTLAQGAGEYIGNLHRTLAETGNAESIAFLKDLFGDRWQNITEAQMGARIAELNQGTYDARSLPYIAPSFRPFFDLSRWSIEQAYHTKKYMIDPLFRGNFKTPVAGVVSSLAAGGLVNALITEVTGVQNSIPTNEEIENAKESEQGKLRAYQLLSLVQMVGAGGIIASLTKGMMDQFVLKADARGFTYPLYEVAKNAAQQTLAAAEAIHQGEDVTDVIPAYLQKMTFGNTQTLRFLQQVALKMGADEVAGQSQQDAERRTDYRNRRMYEITQGLPVPPLQPPQADYTRVAVQKFKRTDDPNVAAQMLPKVIDRAVRRSAGDPSTLKRELHNLRVLPIHSMPDPDRDPQGFQAYYLWLQKTKGPAEARATAARYAKLKQLNELKQAAIPEID